MAITAKSRALPRVHSGDVSHAMRQAYQRTEMARTTAMGGMTGAVGGIPLGAMVAWAVTPLAPLLARDDLSFDTQHMLLRLMVETICVVAGFKLGYDVHRDSQITRDMKEETTRLYSEIRREHGRITVNPVRLNRTKTANNFRGEIRGYRDRIEAHQDRAKWTGALGGITALGETAHLISTAIPDGTITYGVPTIEEIVGVLVYGAIIAMCGANAFSAPDRAKSKRLLAESDAAHAQLTLEKWLAIRPESFAAWFENQTAPVNESKDASRQR